MFCVTTLTRGSMRPSSAIAMCPGLGAAAAAAPKRCSYQIQTNSGWRTYAS